ncbi:MAG: DUF2066 domain-containing protein [Xanthomonadales bacterium]|nr:DUF2066 domain-containing protein [Xanthomonadales bacterium]
MIKVCLALCGLALAGGWTTVGAVTVDPYVAVVPVEDRSEAARQRAFGAALSQALTKLTGRPGDMSGYATARLVRQYRYLERPAESEGESATPVLEVRFDPAGVRNLAASQGLAMWPLERGDTIVWIALEQRGQRFLLGLEPEHADWLAALEENADRRALPVVTPLMDLEDQARVSAAEVWGGFADRISAASERYGADYTLIGRIAPDGFQWSGRWLLQVEEGLLRWESSGDSVDAVIAGGIDGAATRLAEIFAVPLAAGPEAVRLKVSGIGSPEDYARVQAYLAGLSLVTRATLDQVAGDRAVFALETGADATMLKRVLSRSDLLQPDPAGAAGGLDFRLNP